MTRILHLTDTHISAGGAPHGSVDTCATLRAVLERARLSAPDVVVVSGDVSDDGSPESYQLVRGMVHEWADARGAAVLWAVGNHDKRAGFRQLLCDPANEPAQPDELGAAVDCSADAPVFGKVHVAGLDFLILDTQVPGKSYGHVDARQLAWLNAELQSNADTPAVLVTHHPLIPSASVLMNGLGLDNPGDVLQLLDSSRVRVALSGHNHALEMSSVGHGITVVVGAPVTAQTLSVGQSDTEIALRGAGACVVDVLARRPKGEGDVRVFPFLLPDASGEGVVFQLLPEDVRRIIASSGIPAIASSLCASTPDIR
ncbi:MAG: metallophosphoesterase [Bifidobacterium sp.]|jgi:3',5'-cyclic AMP phosphodiesterase CpdA|nr:metallophosphoesterase [Bifidobacterium sp.]